ncbi:MAG: KTSC domain-containing protein [Chromatiaceae bacterium]|nr:KTSC domain-containing protein [Chromatiaceae bacterium]
MVEMHRVLSSAIRAVGYDSGTRRLRIQFTSGQSYDFCGVPPSIYDGLRSASSKGSYYDHHIRHRYVCF